MALKTLKDVLTRCLLQGHEALAQRAVIVLQKAVALKGRADYMGEPHAYHVTDDVITGAVLALGVLDSVHHYAFLAVNELPVDVRATFQALAERGVTVGPENADELLDGVEELYQEINHFVPKPGVVITGKKSLGVTILRGAHALAAIAAMGRPANHNAH